MHLPALPYKQLAASLVLALLMLLASRIDANVVPAAPAPHPAAPRAAHTS